MSASKVPSRTVDKYDFSTRIIPGQKAFSLFTRRSNHPAHPRIQAKLSDRAIMVDTITYSPLGNSVEQLADELVAAVERTLCQTGADKVHLVGHSLGGVVIAQAIAGGGLVGLVDTVITLGSPFGGSPWAGLLPIGDLLRALRPGSPQLRRLASAPVSVGVRWLAVTAALDIVVPGPRSVPAHADVETITVDGVGHLGMLMSRRVVGYIVAALPAHGSPGAAEPHTRRFPRAATAS